MTTGPGSEAPPDGHAADRPYVVVLGVAQDGGFPQAACDQPCCARAWSDRSLARRVACLGVVDPLTRGAWLVDATPDLPSQMHALRASPADAGRFHLEGILLTHAHTGHYTGLMHLGKEAASTRLLPVYTMGRAAEYLSRNSPWNRLVGDGNIDLRPLTADVPLDLTDRLRAEPFLVEHRGEHSETVGYRISTEHRSVTYLPDVDLLDGWSRSIEDELAAVHRLYLDGTFYSAGELPGRDMAQIRHPLVSETIARLRTLRPGLRRKVRFTHLNHTNPLLQAGSWANTAVAQAGLGVAQEGERVLL